MLSEGISCRSDADRISAQRRHSRHSARPPWSPAGRYYSGGAIPDNADYDVIAEPEGTFVGSVNEDFAVESVAGDVFLLGNTSWRIRRVEKGRVRWRMRAGLRRMCRSGW